MEEDNIQEAADDVDNSGEDALLEDKFNTIEEQAKAYLESEKKMRAVSEELSKLKAKAPSEITEPDTRPQLDADTLRQLGVVFKGDLVSQQAEQQFLSERPEAASRLEVLRALQQTDKYAGQSLEDIDNALVDVVPKKQIPVGVKMGMPAQADDTKTLENMTDAELKEWRASQGGKVALQELM